MEWPKEKKEEKKWKKEWKNDENYGRQSKTGSNSLCPSFPPTPSYYHFVLSIFSSTVKLKAGCSCCQDCLRM